MSVQHNYTSKHLPLESCFESTSVLSAIVKFVLSRRRLQLGSKDGAGMCSTGNRINMEEKSLRRVEA